MVSVFVFLEMFTFEFLAAISNKHVQFYCSNENFKITSYTLLSFFQSVSIADMYISSGR